MKQIRRIVRPTLIGMLLALYFFSNTAAAQRDIDNKSELIQALAEKGLTVGATIWLRSPMGDLPGLSKIKFVDADVRPMYSFSNSRKHLVLIGETDGKGEVILEISRYSSMYFAENTIEKFYLTDPSKQVAKWGKKALKAISEGQVYIGMTRDQVEASLGSPSNINVSVGQWGTHSQWVFGKPPSSYLYFENGRLTSWQN